MKRNVQKNLIQLENQANKHSIPKKDDKMLQSQQERVSPIFLPSPWIRYVFIFMIML